MTSQRGLLRALRTTLLLALLLPLGESCTSGDHRPVVVEADLVDEAPAAEAWSETGTVGFAADAPRVEVLGGFGAAAHGGRAAFAWGLGGGSRVGFRRADTRPFRLRLEGWIPSAGAGALRRVDVGVNGTDVGSVEIGPDRASASLEIPAKVLRPGANRLDLRYPGITWPHGGSRPRAVAWSGFRFGDSAAAAPGREAGAAGGIHLAARSGLDFYLEPRAESRLVLGGVVARGGARLEADVACEGEPARYGVLSSAGAGRLEAALRPRGSATVPCRLTLRSAGPEAAGAGVDLASAQVVRPAAAQEAVAPGVVTGTPPAGGRRPNLIVYLVDTLRADHLGVYGCPRPLTPNIDRFAGEGVVIEQARAQSSWTRPAVATVLTGLDPLRLGVTGVYSKLPREARTLGERLRAAGYRTGFVTPNGNVSAEFGFDQGYDYFRYDRTDDAPGAPGDVAASTRRVFESAREFLDATPADRPFFLYVHTVEPHAPYRPLEIFRRRFAPDAAPELGERHELGQLATRTIPRTAERVRAVDELYDGEVATADSGFGRFLAELGERGLLANSAVVFLGDHGEELFDHGNVEHGRTLYEEQLRVPMIWRLPAGAGGGRRLAGHADQLDVTPTMLDLAGLAADPGLPGRSLVPELEGRGELPDRPSVAYLDRFSFDLQSVVSRGRKLIRDRSPRARLADYRDRVFDLGSDPGEHYDLAGRRPILLGLLSSALRGFRARWGPPLEAGRAVIDPALERDLRALGYL
jgi:arylsulfatase A-like enzyme